MVFYILYKYFFFIIILIFEKSIQDPGEIILGENYCKTVQIKNSLVYIFNIEDNYTIHQYNTEVKQIGNYSELIYKNKTILKLNDNKFIIMGISSDNYFIYQIYEFISNDYLYMNDFQNTSLKIPNFKQLDERVITENIILLYGLTQSDPTNIIIYKIDISNNNNEKLNIQNDVNGYIGSGYNQRNIQCDAFDNNYYFCVLSLKGNGKDNNKMIYFRGNFNSEGIILKIDNFCVKGCYLGNIAKVYNKYLICYHQQNSISSAYSQYCQYFSFEENDIIIGKSYEIGNFGVEKFREIPLIIKIYEFSIFIIFDYFYSNNRIANLIIEASLDFTIIIKFQTNLDLYQTTDFFNDNNFIYLVCEEENTKLLKKSFYNCKDNNLVISIKDEDFDFYTNHNNQKIIFSLQEDIILYQGSDKVRLGTIYNLNNENEKFTFKRKDKIGVFQNYYAYCNTDNEIVDSSSLICPLKIVICPDSCKSCDHNQNVSQTNHYCTECNNGFSPIFEESNGKDSYNCYKGDDEKIINYYNDNGIYYHCNNTCKSCINSASCIKCEEKYYFIANKDNIINENDICYNSTTLKETSYYLDYINTIKQFVYKPCYENCLTCKSEGNEKSHNCITCKNGLRKYNFNENQCTVDTNTCLNNQQYWELSNNNIQCISKCDFYIILNGTNLGQCVENCNNFINPYSNSLSNNLYSIICGEQKFCISYDTCNNGYFTINHELRTCEKTGGCKVDFFNKINNLYDSPSYDKLTLIEKKNEIKNRLKIIKVLTNINGFTLTSNYELSLIIEYFRLLKNEESKYIYNKIYLITSTQYLNFTITIYPLDIEDYAYEKIFSFNNLGFVNFTNFYTDFLNYEIERNRIILVGILEYQASNSPIKDLNYFLYSFNEKINDINNLGNLLYLDDLIINFDKNKLEVQYPLFNYINNNSLVNKRNSEYLIDNIKEMYERYPEVELSNLNDSFYNDICLLFTTDEGTDMTLNDRRNEYYVNISLCENNCTLIKVINKDLNPRALCNCDIKLNITFDYQKGINDNFSSYSVQNIKSFLCISETFNYNISKNYIFWIFLIIIILQIYLVIIYIKYKDKIVNKLLGLYDINHDKFGNGNNNNDIIVSSCEDNKYDFKKNITNNSNNKVESQENIFSSYPVNISNPPKKKIDIRGPNNNIPKTDNKIEEKDLISGNMSSIGKETTLKYNEKNQQDFTDTILDDFQNDYEPHKINNTFDSKDMKFNSLYLKNIYLERLKLKKIKNIRNALKPLNQKDVIKYYDTCEDISNSNQNINNHNNQKITKILDGQDIFRSNLLENKSDDENKPRYPKKKHKNDLLYEEEKGILSDDQIIFSHDVIKANRNFLIEEGDSINKVRITNNFNIDDLFINNKKMTLAKSLGKNQFNKLKEEDKNNDERLKTEIDIDMNNKIKREFEIIKKGEANPSPSVGIIERNRKKINSNSSIESEFNNLVKPNEPQTLKIKEKNNYNYNYNDISKGSDSKRIMIKFRGEGERDIYREMGEQNIDEDKIRQKRSRNLELLKEKNFFSSMNELLEIENKFKNKNFCIYYWNYFIKRELWILCIKDSKNTIPYFIRYSSFLLCISFIFLLNCFFFFESDVHKRYLNALSGNKNDIVYYFRNEFITTIWVALIGNVFKMIIIKLIITKVFKISTRVKKMMRASAETGLSQNELEQLQLKRQKYVSDYKVNLLIYFLCLMILNLLIAYICICYGGVFPNSIEAFLYGLFFSLILSFIICAIICFINVSIYKLGKCSNCKCLNYTYVFLSTLY